MKYPNITPPPVYRGENMLEIVVTAVCRHMKNLKRKEAFKPVKINKNN